MSVKKMTKSNVDLLRYVINESPILKEEIDLPVQGADVAKIGQIIVDNRRFKNAFINAINLVALTIITRNDWDNPWEEFTEQGSISMGQSVREMVIDLVEGHDYNETKNDPTNFLKTEVPNIYNYMHDINFQKYYKVSVNDNDIAMAFTTEQGMYNLISNVYNALYKSYKYDKYLIDKYQIQRRIVDGTVPAVTIAGFESADTRDNVAFMKEYSNNLTFMSKNYNPAGLTLATSFDNQRLMISTGFEAKLSTNVLATSYFRNDADFKTKAALIDGFGSNDFERLQKLLGDAYVPFTSNEKKSLSNVVGMIIDDEFFKDYYYKLNNESDTETTEFMNPETLIKNYWLHCWRIFSTSPFVNCLAFTKETSKVNTVTVNPPTATVMKGQNLQLSAVVAVTGIPNKAVVWTVDEPAATANVTINQNGLLKIPAGASISEVTVTATSVYNTSVTGTATITVQE